MQPGEYHGVMDHMTDKVGIVRAMAVVLTLVGGPALAQTPLREGNTWDWRSHEPNPSQVDQAEQRNKLTTPQQTQSQNRQVDELATQLLKQEGLAPGRPPQ